MLIAFAQEHERTPGASRQPQADSGHGKTAAEGHAQEEEHGPDLPQLLARLLNFAILAGTLVYLLRSPVAAYLSDRGVRIRQDLVTAAEMRKTATEQLEEIERRMKALPGEIDALKARGTEEIMAEEARIAETAEAERRRLLEQTRREINLQLRIAERELVSHAAELTISVASKRIKQSITDDDQQRLVDRYITLVRKG